MKSNSKFKMLTIIVYLLIVCILFVSCNNQDDLNKDDQSDESATETQGLESESGDQSVELPAESQSDPQGVESSSDDQSNETSPEIKISVQDFKNYSLEFVSNGDGTCYVSKIINTYECEEQYELVIPEISPDGDTVTEVRASLNFSILPSIILKEDFEEILWKMAENLAPKYDVTPEDIMNNAPIYFKFFKFKSFYLELTEDKLQQYITATPFLEYSGDVYICDPMITLETELELIKLIVDSGYNTEAFFEDYNNLYEKVETNIKDPQIKEDILSSIPEVYTGFGKNIISIKLPGTVIKIDSMIYRNCVDIKEIEIFDSLNNTTEIISPSFSRVLNCISLEKIVFSNGIEIIGDYEFYGCVKLKSIVIPKSIVEIGKYAFEASEYETLIDVYYEGTEEEWNAINILDGNDRLLNATIHYNYIVE